MACESASLPYMLSMSDDQSSRRPEQPRSEPEIIPPDRGERRGRGGGDAYVWTSFDDHGTHRIYVARPGPFSIIVALILGGLLLAAIVLLLAGLVLFWIPVVVLVVAALLLSGYIRHYWRRLRLWMGQR